MGWAYLPVQVGGTMLRRTLGKEKMIGWENSHPVPRCPPHTQPHYPYDTLEGGRKQRSPCPESHIQEPETPSWSPMSPVLREAQMDAHVKDWRLIEIPFDTILCILKLVAFHQGI